MDTESPLAHIDSFAYRHRLAEVMSRPVLTGDAGWSVAEAAAVMDREAKSSLVVVDAAGRAAGIFTERDMLRLAARHRAEAGNLRLGEVMASPVKTVAEDDFLFVALGRMSRLGLRHLVVVDHDGRPTGMITARALMKIRVTDALVIGDNVEQAQSADEMAAARAQLPRLARNLLAEGVPARHIAAVISQVLRDMTARAAQLALDGMAADGWGPAPARWAVMVLGSGGRGESLLAFDQDNALVHDGEPTDDPWFAELGRRLNDLLAAAGLPYCAGEVMVRNPEWRKPLKAWKDTVWRWVHEPADQTVMNCDIFFDLQPVYGDRALAEELRAYALDIAAGAPFFVQYLALNLKNMEVPLTLWGGFKTRDRRLNAKKHGLLPIVGAARAKAVRDRLTVTGTYDRYAAVVAAGRMHPEDLRSLGEAHEVMLRVMLEQQLDDIAAGLPPGAEIDPRHLDRGMQARLRRAFRRIGVLRTIVANLGAS